jgi:hypothetical protein
MIAIQQVTTADPAWCRLNDGFGGEYVEETRGNGYITYPTMPVLNTTSPLREPL